MTGRLGERSGDGSTGRLGGRPGDGSTGRLGERPGDGSIGPGTAAASLRGWGAGARAAGAVLALGYLLGLVRGPVTAVVGGLALLTLGRCAAASGSDDLVLGGALAVIAGALQVGGLRWETLDLTQIRGAQAVLGPTVLVGPEVAALASWLGAAAATASLAAWLATSRAGDEAVAGRLTYALWIAEAVVGAFAVVTVFWGGAVPRGSFGGGGGALAVLEWLAAIAVVAGAAVAGATYLGRLPSWRGWVVGASGGGVAGAAVLIATAA